MEVVVEKLSNLERRVMVTVSAQEIDDKTTKELEQLSKTIKLAGFRPGKVPFSVVKQHHGDSARNDIIADTIQMSYFEMLSKEKLRPAGQPHLEPKDSKFGEPLEYVATFEVYPEMEFHDLKNEKVEKIVAKIKDEDMDKMVDNLRKQQAEWKEVKRAAKNGDQLSIDFEGKIKSEAFQGGTAKDFKLELGAGSMLDGFEKPLVGAKAGDIINLKVKFPKDYGSVDVAGKKADFEVKVHKVSESVLPEINAKFLKTMGIQKGGVTELRKKIQHNMGQQLAQAVEKKFKDKLLDKLLEINRVELPKILVDSEIERLQEQAKQQFSQYTKGDVADIPDLPREEFEETAKRRVRLGLLLAEMVEKEKIKVDQAKVKAKLESLAVGYKNPDEVVQWYYNNKQYLAEVESLILEESVVEKLQQQVDVKEKTVSYEEAINA